MRRYGQRDIGQKLRLTKRERDNSRESIELLLRQVNKNEGIVREARDRDRNTRAKDIRGINDEINDMGK